MKKGLFTSLVLILLCGTTFAQWNNLGPWPNANYPGGTHGIAVSPDGKVWTASYYRTNWNSPGGAVISVSPIIVFNADGSLVDTIYTVTSPGPKIDTLKGQCRGMGVDADGNILYVQSSPGKMIKINYQTLEGMGSKLLTEIGSSPTAPSVSLDGTIYVGPVVGGGTTAIAKYDKDLNWIGNAVVGPPNIARTMEISPDGLSLYWIPFTSTPPQIYIYTRASELDDFSATPTDSALQGMSIETSAWQPGTGLLWVSNDKRGTGPYTHLTWYGYNVTTKTIVDSFTLAPPIPGAGDELPRGLDFSPDGKIAYVGLFGSAFNRIYKFDTTPPSEYKVTFSIDMGVQAFEKAFDVTTGKVWVRGDFQTDAGDPNGNWQGNMFELTDTDGDTIYTITVTFPVSSKGKTYNFKYVMSPDNWESSSNRLVTINAANINLPKVWFNNDNIYTVLVEVTNTINFTADITSILGIGVGGAFDANQDSLLVMGLDWDNLGKNVVGKRKMTAEDPFNPGIFTTSLTFTSSTASAKGVGDSTKWKFKAYPDGRFANTGWETGSDRWHIYQADGNVITLPTIVPRIYPLFGPIANDVPLQFNVDMTGAVNRYNGQPIDPSQVEFVGMRGGAGFLGSWAAGGNWTVNDTATVVNGYQLMRVLHKVSGNLWRIDIVAPAGTNAGVYEYKFAAVYPFADTVNGGSSPLDNEGGFGQNHSFVLSDKPSGFVFNHQFGNFNPVGVERVDNALPTAYALSQNYPNPFNPSTTINYSIPEAGLVTVKVFNLLGQEVATLVNTQQATGNYKVSFNASSLSSGIYLYSIQVNNFKTTKKMILMK